MTDDLVKQFTSHGRDAGLFLDFDGTLSEIVTFPHDARPFPGIREVLEELDRKLGLVVIVSGRAAVQLLDWLGPSIEIWGTHGAERTVDGKVRLTELAQPHAALMKQVLEDARSELEALDMPGVVLEDKTVMVGLHFRAAENMEAARAALDSIAQRLAERYGLLRAGGKLAFELRPPIPFSKSDVVMNRAGALKAVAFIGDDVVDLPGFDALDELEAHEIMTLRVGVDSSEAPEELLARADIVVQGPEGVLGLLKRIAELIPG